MSRERREAPPSAGSFFGSLVLLGGSLAMACSGKVDEPDGVGTGGRSSGGSDSVDVGSGGVGVGTGGVSSSGGVPQAGGVSSGGRHATGGDQGLGGEVHMGGSPWLDCPPEQWDCSGLPYLVDGYDEARNLCAYRLPEGCVCDSTRPERVYDCDLGETMICKNAIYDTEGRATDDNQPFECQCVPIAEGTLDSTLCNYCTDRPDVNVECELRYARSDYPEVLCGCEVELTILR